MRVKNGKINSVQLKSTLTSLCLICILAQFPKKKGSLGVSYPTASYPTLLRYSGKMSGVEAVKFHYPKTFFSIIVWWSLSINKWLLDEASGGKTVKFWRQKHQVKTSLNSRTCYGANADFRSCCTLSGINHTLHIAFTSVSHILCPLCTPNIGWPY